jgi:hypothetical protein
VCLWQCCCPSRAERPPMLAEERQQGLRDSAGEEKRVESGRVTRRPRRWDVPALRGQIGQRWPLRACSFSARTILRARVSGESRGSG